jgi:hypothetical protein
MTSPCLAVTLFIYNYADLFTVPRHGIGAYLISALSLTAGVPALD